MAGKKVARLCVSVRFSYYMLLDVTSLSTRVDACLIFFFLYFHIVQLKGKGKKRFHHDDVLPLDCSRHFSACFSQTEKAGANKSRGRQREGRQEGRHKR